MTRCIAVLVAVFVVSTAHAQVYVSTTGNNTTGDSWVNAFTDVAAGVAAADSQNEQLWIAGGTYSIAAPITVGAGVQIYGGFPTTGNPGFGDRDTDTFQSILDANSTGSILVINNVSGVILDGLEFTEATGTAGGAVRIITNANVDVNDCVFFTNNATVYGAGVYIDNGAHADITLSEFDGNTAPEAPALMLFQGTASVSQSSFTNNDGSVQGGAILTYEVAITIDRCVFDTNDANRGGAVAIREGTGGSITNSLFVNNVANDHGGGVNIEDQDAYSVMNNTFVDNTAATRGGGVFVHDSNGGTIANNIFVNNTEHAIYENNNAADPDVFNNMFFQNPDGVYFDEGTTSYMFPAALDAAVAEASGNINNDPEFVDAPNGDYHIDSDSPARNSGSNDGSPMLDIDGEFRDASPDIGFDEQDPGLPLSRMAGLVCALALVAMVVYRERRRIS